MLRDATRSVSELGDDAVINVFQASPDLPNSTIFPSSITGFLSHPWPITRSSNPLGTVRNTFSMG
jgi:hypothetical protein